MDWQQELITAIFWLFKAFFWVVLVLGVSAWVLKLTPFGKKFWHITKLCLDRANTTKTFVMIGILIFFVLLEVKISVLNTQFYNKLYSSLQEMDVQTFWFFALLNAGLMMFKVGQEVVDTFVGETFEIRWLERFNAVLLDRYLSHKNYYRLKYTHSQHSLDNIDQRIEQDAKEFITTTVQMVRGVINAVMSIIEFTIILWGLSGILSVFGISVPKGVVFFIYTFIIIATALSVWIGRPLIRLNFDKERLHGDYRYLLIRVAENAESIAFYDGEHQERRHLTERFGRIIDNRWAIVKRMLGLDGFNTGVTQVAMLLPLMLQAPRFFVGEIKLGDMHQTVQSFNRLMRALSFFRLFYETFTLYQARLNRLYGFLMCLNVLDDAPLNQSTLKHDDKVLILKNFGVKTSNDKVLINGINMTLNAGQALLIQGMSGVGKTTLLKAMAGIYPFATMGQAVMPNAKTLFLPQRPYMPQGTLRHAICYPDIPADDDKIKAAMVRCHLGRHIHALDVDGDWQINLSPGELQRVAFVRALLVKPSVVFLDETTSALDESTEAALYATLRDELPDAIIVSVGHRSTLLCFHDKRLMLG